MRKTIVAVALVSAAALLGGCAGGFSGGSMLPATSQTALHRQDILGGPPHRVHPQDIVGGPPHTVHPQDILGGPPRVHRY